MGNNEKTQPALNKIKLIAAWFFGVLFTVSGISLLIQKAWITGLLLLLLGLYLIPAMKKKIPSGFYDKIQSKNKKHIIFGCIVSLIVALAIDASNANQREVELQAELNAKAQAEAKAKADEKEKAEEQAQINYYKTNTDDVFIQLEKRTIEHAYAYTTKYEPLIKDLRLTNYHNEIKPKYLALMKKKAKEEKAKQERAKGVFNKENYTEGDWPYTVNKITVGCFVDGTFIERNGNKYALNGVAQGKRFNYSNISEVTISGNDDQLIRNAALATCDAATAARKKRIESEQLSAWDGSHRKLERLLKESLNDPDSYEHVNSYYYVKTYPLRIRLEYRARNGFGGIVKGYVLAEVAENGDVLSIIDQG